jgi:hypothetical protein
MSQTIAAAHRLKPSARSAGLPRAYVMTWVGLAGIAASYLSFVAVRGFEPIQSAELSKEPTHLAETTKLRESLKEFQADLGHLRADIETRGPDPSSLATLAAIEERMSLETGQPVAKTAPRSTSLATAGIATAGTAPVAAVVPPPAVPAPISAAPAAPVSTPTSLAVAPPGLDALMKPLETGSILPITKQTSPLPKAPPSTPAPSLAVLASPAVATPAAIDAAPIAFGPAVVKAEPKPFGVQLSSGATLDAIRLSWSLLAEQHPDALRNLKPRFTATGSEDTGKTFDLMAGPVRSAADAKKICKSLAARGTDCRVAEYAGEGL